MVDAPASLDALKKGHTFPRAEFSLSADDRAAYLDAVGDEAFRALAKPAELPPLAAAALALRSLLGMFDLPEGAVHTGQEIEFVRPARVGEPLVCEASVVQSSDRQGMRFATIEQRVQDGEGRDVLIGRSSIIVPLGGAPA